MGMLQPTSGELIVGGLSAFADSVAVKELVGYLPDEPVFYDFMRGRDIVRFVGEMHGLDPATIEARSSALAERLSVADAMEEFAESYSRGMKKKLGLICALLHEPALVVLDEPTNGLDVLAIQAMHRFIRLCREEGKCVLMSTHIMAEAVKLCDHIGILHQGRIFAAGTLNELREHTGKHYLEDIFVAVVKEQVGELGEVAEFL